MINKSKLIGSQQVIDYVEETCKNANIYKHSTRKPGCIIVNRSKGQGRTKTLEYIADSFKESEVLSFSSGNEDYIEVHFDGTYDNYNDCIESIRDAQVYHNTYDDGIISICAYELWKHKNEKQWTEFLPFIENLCKNCFVVFFVPSETDYENDFFVSEIKKHVKKVKEIYLPPYTSSDYASIVLCIIEDEGIAVIDEESALKEIKKIIENRTIKSIEEAEDLTYEILLKAVDYKKYGATLITKRIANVNCCLGGNSNVK